MIDLPPLPKVCPVCTMDERGRTQTCVIDDATRLACRCSCHRPRSPAPPAVRSTVCVIIGCGDPRFFGQPAIEGLCRGHHSLFFAELDGADYHRPTAVSDFRDRLWKLRAIEIEAEKRQAAISLLVTTALDKSKPLVRAALELGKSLGPKGLV